MSNQLTFSKYQLEALDTDQNKDCTEPKDLSISLLGLAGEVGGLLTEFKKRIRDGEAYEIFDQNLEEELGDILWYLSNIASKNQLDLGEIATKNLFKTQEKWAYQSEQSFFLDETFPTKEQFPRIFSVTFSETNTGNRTTVDMIIDGQKVGDTLSDNAHIEDGYRYHDVIHLSFVAYLGWSPVLRKLMGLKRKSKPEIDEVEDGARSAIIEELIVAFLYETARNNDFYSSPSSSVDGKTIASIKGFTSHLEVSRRRSADWNQATKKGFQVFKRLTEQRGGTVEVNMQNKTLIFKE